MEFHAYANLFPLLQGSAFADLAQDIASHGLVEPIVIFQEKIVDGRNRFLACKEVGVEPEFVQFQGKEENLLDYVLSTNLHRRHLNESQRALVASNLAVLKVGSSSNAPIGAITQKEAAEKLNVSRRAVQRARQVEQKGTAELVQAVKQGSASLGAAVEVARLPKEQQKEVVLAGTVAETAKQIKKAHVTNNSGNNEWYTPQHIVEAARLALGEIDLDPASCATANQVVQAGEYFTADQDGLAQAWRGRVWLNPPYSRDLCVRFADKLLEELLRGNVQQACVLVNNATDTQWCQKLLAASSAVCLLRGRVRFLDHTGKQQNTPLQGQLVLYFGAGVEKFRASFAALGVCFGRLEGEA